jgi:hypothetical protein
MAGDDDEISRQSERNARGGMPQCCLIRRMGAMPGVPPKGMRDRREKSLWRRRSAVLVHHAPLRQHPNKSGTRDEGKASCLPGRALPHEGMIMRHRFGLW